MKEKGESGVDVRAKKRSACTRQCLLGWNMGVVTVMRREFWGEGGNLGCLWTFEKHEVGTVPAVMLLDPDVDFGSHGPSALGSAESGRIWWRLQPPSSEAVFLEAFARRDAKGAEGKATVGKLGHV